MAGNYLGEIKTDQGTFKINAQEDGFVAKYLVPAESNNTPVKVGVPMLVCVDDEEDIGVFKDFFLHPMTNNRLNVIPDLNIFIKF